MNNKRINITKEVTLGLKTFIEGYYKGRFFEAEYFYDNNSFTIRGGVETSDKDYISKCWVNSENLIYNDRKLLKVL